MNAKLNNNQPVRELLSCMLWFTISCTHLPSAQNFYTYNFQIIEYNWDVPWLVSLGLYFCLKWLQFFCSQKPCRNIGYRRRQCWCLHVRPQRWQSVSVMAVYVGCATVGAAVWWFMVYDQGPQLSYYQLVSHPAVRLGGASKGGESNNCTLKAWLLL